MADRTEGIASVGSDVTVKTQITVHRKSSILTRIKYFIY